MPSPGQPDALRRWREEHPEGFERSEPRTPWEKIRDNPRSVRARVNAFCCNCMGWEVDGPRAPGIVQDIRACCAPACPLYDIRPYRDAKADQSSVFGGSEQ